MGQRYDADLRGIAAIVLGNRTPRRRSRARAGGVEESQVHDRPRGRRIRRADHFHHALRLFRGAGGSVHRRAWCPLDTLPGDRYTYHENTRKIIGERSRRQFSIGDQVQVRLDRVDGVEKKLQFSVVEQAKSRKKR